MLASRLMQYLTIQEAGSEVNAKVAIPCASALLLHHRRNVLRLQFFKSLQYAILVPEAYYNLRYS